MKDPYKGRPCPFCGGTMPCSGHPEAASIVLRGISAAEMKANAIRNSAKRRIELAATAIREAERRGMTEVVETYRAVEAAAKQGLASPLVKQRTPEQEPALRPKTPEEHAERRRKLIESLN